MQDLVAHTDSAYYLICNCERKRTRAVFTGQRMSKLQLALAHMPSAKKDWGRSSTVPNPMSNGPTGSHETSFDRSCVGGGAENRTPVHA